MARLTKAGIVDQICKEIGFSKREAAELVDKVFDILKETLARGENVRISGFGNFSILDKSARTGRNPQTGEAMEIVARRVLTYSSSQLLREDINARYAHRLAADGSEDTSVAPKQGPSNALDSFISNSGEREER